MLPRFYAPDLDPAAADVSLPEAEAHHLTRVLRLGPGDDVAVFDGRGREYRARVSVARRGTVRLDLIAPSEPAPEPALPIAVVQAVLKPEAMDDAVRDATMMGASAVVPAISAHVTVKARALDGPRAAERWRRIALASAKQCRRATLPAISDPTPFEAWLRASDQALKLLLVEPSVSSSTRSLREWSDRPAPASLAVIVGPEGGWAAEEVEMAVAAGCVPITLGGLTLRADAVPLAALAICRFVFEPLTADRSPRSARRG
jgi:16S rRNA (uracil1498-N3)-methyltransferase